MSGRALAPSGAKLAAAFALGLDPLFVGSHHLARFFIISLALPLVARWLAASGLMLRRSSKG